MAKMDKRTRVGRPVQYDIKHALKLLKRESKHIHQSLVEIIYGLLLFKSPRTWHRAV